jgi:hypothetical protein
MRCVRLLAVATAESVLPLTVRALPVVRPDVMLMSVSMTVAVTDLLLITLGHRRQRCPPPPYSAAALPRTRWSALEAKSDSFTVVLAVLPVAVARFSVPEMVNGEFRVVPVCQSP